MIELNSFKSSISADTAFRKELPCRGALLVPYMHDQLFEQPTVIGILLRYHDKTVPSSARMSRGATRLSYP